MLSFEEVAEYGSRYTVVPLSRRMLADGCTPVEVLRRLRHESDRCYILESMEGKDRRGRYTFLGYDPSLEIRGKKGRIEKIDKQGRVTVLQDTPHAVLQQVTALYRAPVFPDLPPFTGGLVGYFSFNYLRYTEPVLAERPPGEEGLDDFDLHLFEKVIVFDHVKQEIVLISNVRLADGRAGYAAAEAALAEMARLITDGKPAAVPPLQLTTPLQPLFSEAAYVRMVTAAKRYIREGDIFQVVLANRWEATAAGSLFDTYRLLRSFNPSPYMFYFSVGDTEIAGSSPETLVRIGGGRVTTYPLAGTHPRGATEAADKRLEEELLHNEKELAEHNMLVDLGRNDIGRVSRPGSVHVASYLQVLRFSHVMHLGSTVVGTLAPGVQPVQVMEAVLPAGTLSGAPKIRAYQIIDELEQADRGLYGGAIGYLDFTGNMDVCIAIRLAYKHGRRLIIRAGAGIVADSDPQREYEECCHKAEAVRTAVERADGGIRYDSFNR